MKNRFEIPLSELIYEGITVEDGNYVKGQILRNKDDYYICEIAHNNRNKNKDIFKIHKVDPYTVNKVDFEEFKKWWEEEEYRMWGMDKIDQMADEQSLRDMEMA